MNYSKTIRVPAPKVQRGATLGGAAARDTKRDAMEILAKATQHLQSYGVTSATEQGKRALSYLWTWMSWAQHELDVAAEWFPEKYDATVSQLARDGKLLAEEFGETFKMGHDIPEFWHMGRYGDPEGRGPKQWKEYGQSALSRVRELIQEHIEQSGLSPGEKQWDLNWVMNKVWDLYQREFRSHPEVESRGEEYVAFTLYPLLLRNAEYYLQQLAGEDVYPGRWGSP